MPTLILPDPGSGLDEQEIYDYDINGNVIYVGRARPGVPTSMCGWKIKKLTWNASNQITNTQWANGLPTYTAVWDNRTTTNFS